MDKIYIIDDTFKISEEVQNMSEEEMNQQFLAHTGSRHSK